MENSMFWPVAAGLLINSALFLGGVIAAGLVLDNQMAWACALLSAGCCYISYYLQMMKIHGAFSIPSFIVPAITYASIALGALAGLSLLF